MPLLNFEIIKCVSLPRAAVDFVTAIAFLGSPSLPRGRISVLVVLWFCKEFDGHMSAAEYKSYR